MTAEPHKLNDFAVGVEPYKQEVALYMAFHTAFILTVQHVGQILSWYRLLVLQQLQHILQGIKFLLVVGVPLQVFLVFRGWV